LAVTAPFFAAFYCFCRPTIKPFGLSIFIFLVVSRGTLLAPVWSAAKDVPRETGAERQANTQSPLE
jgi:hypothetical protein